MCVHIFNCTMYKKVLVVVLLFGACFAAPQPGSFHVSVSGSVEPPPPSEITPPESSPIPEISLPESSPVPETSPTELPTVPETSTLPQLPGAATLPGSPSTLPTLPAQMNLLGCSQLASLFSLFPLSSLVPPGTQVTVPAISDNAMALILAKLKDAAGNFDPTKVTDLLKSVILKDLHFKQQLAEAAVGTIKNLLNQTQNIRGYPDGACVWNGGNITLPNIPFDQGIIQGVSDFVPKSNATLVNLLRNMNGTVGALLRDILNHLEALPTFNFNDIFNNATFLVPSKQILSDWLKVQNLLNLLNNIKSIIIPGCYSLEDFAHMTSVKSFVGNQFPISYASNSTHLVLNAGPFLNTTFSSYYASGSNGNVVIAS